MSEYTFQTIDGNYVTVEAFTIEVARYRVMVKRWGAIPDVIVPHAPDYKGLGLALISTKEI